MERKSSRGPRDLSFAELLVALYSKGRWKKAQRYQFSIPLYLNIVHGISKTDIMKMSVEDIIAYLNLPPKPRRYRGWHFNYGVKAYE